MPKLHFLGDLFCDIIASDLKVLPHWGEDALANIEALPGGSALNSAVHASVYCEYLQNKLGNCPVQIGLFTASGIDYQSSICNDLIETHGKFIENHIIRKHEYRTGTCIVITGNSDRCFITDRGCVRDISVSWFDRNYLISSEHIHMSGFYNCNTLQTEIIDLFHDAQKSGKTTSLTPQFDATGLWAGILQVCPYLTFFIGNQAEAKRAAHSEDMETAAYRMLEAGCKYVVITRGHEGVRGYFKVQHHELKSTNASSEIGMKVEGGEADNSNETLSSDKAIPWQIAYIEQAIPATVPVVDTTGAGDGFVAGFLVDWLLNHDLTRALRGGCFVGTAAVTLIGGSTASVGALTNLESQIIHG